MPSSFDILEAEVLRLSATERARLLDRLIASLDADKARDEAWDRIAAERDAEVDAGAEGTVAIGEVLDRLRAQIQ